MRVVERLTVLAVVCCLMGLGAGAALAGDLKSEVASCFPAAPAGYQAEEEVSFDIDPGDDLLEYLRQNSEVRREYTGGQTIGVNILGNGLQAFINAANGMLPGCDTLKVAGRKASVFYDSALVVVVGNKAVVEITFDDGWDASKGVVLPLAEKFDYDKLASLLK